MWYTDTEYCILWYIATIDIPQYVDIHIVARGHTYSITRTHTDQYVDTHISVCGRIYSSMRTHISVCGHAFSSMSHNRFVTPPSQYVDTYIQLYEDTPPVETNSKKRQKDKKKRDQLMHVQRPVIV